MHVLLMLVLKNFTWAILNVTKAYKSREGVPKPNF